MRVSVPPIKSQGIKTKLVPWIKELIPDGFSGTWIEPFMGTGVVGFNLLRHKAMMCDTNPHIVNFYQAIKDEEITPGIVRNFLQIEGLKLLETGKKHYYDIRKRFNMCKDPLDFLFLSRAGFNGMIRFNRKGEFNIPFCNKPNRFAQAYVTKIVNQVENISKLLKVKEITFSTQDFEKTILEGCASDVIYCDPPYIGRHVDYFNGWSEENEIRLFNLLEKTRSKFILSTWHHNDYRDNEYIEKLWKKFNILTREHFYHVGAKEKNRNPMIEAIVTNIDLSYYEPVQIELEKQLVLLEKPEKYE